ncbi:MAG: sigma-70 family RNA polymerase sigma factor [Alphaproteobacteria bacterium]|nr:sigma-70 family RNA polymerase sigma factor [Alphaproteobacteria bacterium]
MLTDDISALLTRLANKDRAALGQLYPKVASKLLGLLTRMLGDRDEAEDALQEVIIRLWQRAATYDPQKGTAMGWVCAIARNHALDRLRARPAARGHRIVTGGEEMDVLDTIADPAMGVEDQTMLRARMQAVVACFDELPEDRARAVKGAYLMGLSYQELATKFDVPLNTMRTWLRRALISLRECLDR